LTTTDFTGLQFTDTNDNENKNGYMDLLDDYEDDEDEDEDDEGCSADKDEERTVVSADVLRRSDIVVGQGSVTVENDMCDSLDVGLFGPDDIYFYGEVGCWKDSGRDSQMVNARQFEREGCTEMTISDDEKEEFYMEDAFDDNAITLEVPEEYDRCTDNKKDKVEAEEEGFGRVLQFPTARRPVDYRRTLPEATEKEVDDWFTTTNITLGAQLKEKEEKEAKLLLYTWKDAFASQIEEMLVTDLVEHRIPVYPGAQPRRAKDKIYTKEERDWLDANLPQLERAGVIGRSESPWSHRTKFVRKKDGGLRMVHVFCPANEATMLSSYPMKWIEPVINNLMQSKYSIYFQADAANGFWAVRMYAPHAYRTSFSTYNGQWQYLRMGQGLSGAPQTYTRMKDIFSGYIPAPNPEPTLNKSSSGAFECFVDDDFGAHPDFSSQFEFLHNHYFPRLGWAKLTLKGSKSHFFLDKISPLGYESDGSGLWPSLDKVKAIREYPRPTDLAEIEQFLFLTIFLRQFIPGRVEHARILKEAVQYTDNSDGIMNRTWIPNGKRGHPKRV